MTRRGMTLIEMLVALTATLLLMAAVAQAFSAFGGAVSGSRALLELDGRMRNVAWRLRTDLAGATARPLPPLSHDAGEGYLEIIEGPFEDADAAGGLAVGPADIDDVLLFTTRSTDTPFIGRAPTLSGTTVVEQNDLFESTVAEVAWFARQTPDAAMPVTFTLYRRQLLVMGYVGTDPFHSTPGGNNSLPWATGGSTWAGYFNLPCDVSVRLEGNTLYPNSLADLTRRETRFLHKVTAATGFPFIFANGSHQATTAPDGLIFETTQRQGEDVVLTNVLAFDVRVFDPAAPVAAVGATAVVPGDSGAVTPAAAWGAYVDLGHGITTSGTLAGKNVVPLFSGAGISALAGARTYDTWTTHYEANGRDEDEDAVVDEGTNGEDNNNDGTIDDAGERETSPPYPVPLRGIEVRIRCYEPASRQVRQVTVRHTFVPH